MPQPNESINLLMYESELLQVKWYYETMCMITKNQYHNDKNMNQKLNFSK